MKPRIRVEFDASQVREIVKQYLENNFSAPGAGEWALSGGYSTINAEFEYAEEPEEEPKEFPPMREAVAALRRAAEEEGL